MKKGSHPPWPCDSRNCSAGKIHPELPAPGSPCSSKFWVPIIVRSSSPAIFAVSGPTPTTRFAKTCAGATLNTTGPRTPGRLNHPHDPEGQKPEWIRSSRIAWLQRFMLKSLIGFPAGAALTQLTIMVRAIYPIERCWGRCLIESDELLCAG